MRNIPAILGAAFVITCCLFSGVAARSATSAEPAALLIAQAEPDAPEGAAGQPPDEDKKRKKTKKPKKPKEWLPLLLLIPGIVGLWIAALQDYRFGREDTGGATAGEEASDTQQESSKPHRNRFCIAAVAGTIWGLTLLAMAEELPSPSASQQSTFQLFHTKLGFYLFVPVLGYVGALLYVLDLSRKGREDIPKGTEFGMRLIIGPYVAIVMVLFAEKLGLLEAKAAEPFGQGILAFFSGLLVVLAFQGLVEKGQEVLGSWRENTRYAPSEVAKAFNLTKEEDLDLRQAGIQHLSQLRARSSEALKGDAQRSGLDEDFLLDLKKEAQKAGIRKAIGNLAWKALKTTPNFETIEDFARLNDNTLDEVATKSGKIKADGLKKLRDKAAELSVGP
jgi:hypothetical protein